MNRNLLVILILIIIGCDKDLKSNNTDNTERIKIKQEEIQRENDIKNVLNSQLLTEDDYIFLEKIAKKAKIANDQIFISIENAQVKSESYNRWSRNRLNIVIKNGKIFRLSVRNFLCKIDFKELSLWDKLSHLEEIYITDCNIENLQEINNLKGLRIIQLYSNRITRINKLKLQNLETLTIKNNLIIMIEDLDELPKLKNLDLSYNEIYTIEGLDNLKNLKKLYLSSNQINKIQSLDNLMNLEELDLSRNKISKIEGLDKLSQLKILNLSFNQIKKLEELNKLSNLEYLELINNQIIKIEGLNDLKKLENLNLLANKIQKV